MKKHYYDQFNLVAKFSLIGFLSLMLALNFVFASNTNAQYKSVKEVFLKIGFDNTDLFEVFRQIEDATDYHFTVHENDALLNEKVSINRQKMSVEQILLEISEQKGLKFQQINNNIGVRKLESKDRNRVEVMAQTTVSGKISSSDDGEGLPGASVVVSGTTNGTITDADGMYTLNIPAGATTLDISFVGMQSQTISINGRSVIDVALTADVGQLEEVVVIGFGERQKKDLTSSISTMGSKAIEESAFLSPEMAMQGRMAGVRVVSGGGNANDAPQIFVRGIGTFSGESQPMYVVDGQIISQVHADNRDLTNTGTNLWNMIDPNDIESISVLKDASAAAVYGSRAANGVILITTKRGKVGTPKVEFSSRTGFSNIPKFDMLNTEQLRNLTNEAWGNNSNPNITRENNLYGRNAANTRALLNGFAPQLDPTSPFFISSNETYDWQEEALQKNARIEDYDVKISGATESFDYYFSVGYSKQENPLKTAGTGGVERYNLTTNINSQISRFIQTGATIRVGYNVVDRNTVGNLYDMARISPWQPIYAEDAPHSNPFAVSDIGYAVPSIPTIDSANQTNWNMARLYGEQTKTHPFSGQMLSRGWSPELRNMGQGYIKIEPIPGLSIRGGLSLDYVFTARRSVSDIRNAWFAINANDPANQGDGSGTTAGSAGVRQSRRFNYQADLTINFNRSFGDHNIDVTLVGQDTYFRTVVEDFSNPQTVGPATSDRVTWSNDGTSVSFLARREAFWYGYAARASYSFASKYYLDVAVRRDASSGFPPDKDLRWGIFPSVSAAWRLSDESFFSVPFVNNLKLRGGWGQAGNDERVVGRFAYLSQAIIMGSYALGQGNGNSYGNYQRSYLLTQFSNPNLTWETTTTSYFGFDAVMLDNKFNASVELYSRLTTGILQSVQVPLVTGTLSPLDNIGEVVNQGIDIELGYNGNVGDFQYNLGGNIAFVRNEVTKLYQGAPITTTAASCSGCRVDAGRIEEGRSIGHLWGYQVGGIFQSDAEVLQYFDGTLQDTQHDRDGNGQPRYVQAGDMYFKNIGSNPTDEDLANGIYYSTEPDDLINQFDQTEIGKTIPDFTYGINLGGSWKGFDASINWYGEAGAQRYNYQRAGSEDMASRGVGQWVTTLNRWTPENPSTEMPRAVAGDPAGNNRFSDRFVESANFFRLQNWTIGYSLPKNVIDNVEFISRLRVYIGGQNNLYFFRWSGVDPMSPTTPLPRSFWVGLNVSF